MIIIQTETSNIAAETPREIPQIEVQLEESDVVNDVENTQEEDVLHAYHRITVISDTDYNASAESNNSSRRSSIDVPHFELCSHRDYRRRDNCDGDEYSEVGRL